MSNTASKTLITNIAQLVAVPPGPLSGDAFSHPPIIENAALLIENGKIAWFGQQQDAPTLTSSAETIDAEGGTVVPGLIDCHTHVVHAGSRENEFVQRIQGASYIEILEAGGGIKNSVRMLREATEEELVAQARPRIERMMQWGMTTLEAKSGYGLSHEDELKTLRAIKRLNDELPIEIVGTYLGAHTIPPEFDGKPDAYLDRMLDRDFLKAIVDEGLAEFADVFCERGAFNLDQARRFLTTCKEAGLTPKIHSEQITRTGATKMAAELGAISADHLEFVNDDDIAALRQSGTIPVVLPGCSFFLGSPPAPARCLIDAGLPVALATDLNPGSCNVEPLPLIMSMACTMLKMTPLEALVACTANAAAALGRTDKIGAIAVGHRADVLILDMPNVNQWAYRVGVNGVARTIVGK